MKGDLPSELGSLSQLEHLDFSKCNHNFTLINVYDVSCYSSLWTPSHHLILAGDFEIVEQPGSKKTTGTLPTELGQLLKWKYILLQNNNFRGGVPAEYGNLESTEALWLSEYQHTVMKLS